MGIPKLIGTTEEEIATHNFDTVVIIYAPKVDFPELSLPEVTSLKAIDKNFENQIILLATTQPIKRLVLSPTGPLNRDYDDVRRVSKAARMGVEKAKSAGAVAPLLKFVGIPHANGDYSRALEASLLEVLQGLYHSLQAREYKGENSLETIEKIGFIATDQNSSSDLIKLITSIEIGRRLARDIGGGDPERMSPINSAKYILNAFKDISNVKIEVIDDNDFLLKSYPLLHAVARCSTSVERHRPCVVRLEYTPPSPAVPKKTLLFSGKGVTYDTGGADIKAGGIMAGMHVDKEGAAAIAGLVLTVALMAPSDLKIVAELGFVRNSIGSNAYVADEIILSHAGERVLIGNTDAEGRLVLADCLSHLREYAVANNDVDPHFYTVATLTGHAALAVGNYSITMDNGPARTSSLSLQLQSAGHKWGNAFEVSTIRKEDFDYVKPTASFYDILQCGNQPSSRTPRGHQFPAAFLLLASGLSKHGIDSDKPFKYSHLDIAGAGSEGDIQTSTPTATPLIALVAQHLLNDF